MLCSSAERLAAILLATGLAIACGSSPAKPAKTAKTATASPEATAPGQAIGAAIITAGAASVPPTPPPPTAWLVRVTVISADVRGRMPNGEQWDEKSAKRSGVAAALARYLRQHVELVDTLQTVGIPISSGNLGKEAQKTPAADPMVLVDVAGTVFRTPMRPRAFSPVWKYPLQFLMGKHGKLEGVRGDALVHFHVADYDGPTSYDSMGSTLMTVDELVAKKIHRLGPFGQVNSLLIQVERTPVTEVAKPKVVRLAVSGRTTWMNTNIELVAGQAVDIEAADEVCTKGKSADNCSGPEGQRRPSSYNSEGFKKLGHGALVGAVGDTRFPVRRQRSFIAPSSGKLFLGINDRDAKNNGGAYAVRVIVRPFK